MMTIFACPKPFNDIHIRTIQRNAIRSWLRLAPRPQIILFGNEAGTAETCVEFSLVHVPNVARNEFGTPLLNDVFAQAEALSADNILCYSNADIILLNDFTRCVSVVTNAKQRFLMGGRPWNLEITEELDFDEPQTAALANRAVQEGNLRIDWACDFFVFPKGFWGDLPPFAIGRAGFDNALLFRARQSGGALIDATRAVVAVHQTHGYPSHLEGANYLANTEALRNLELAGGTGRLRTWRHATHVVRGGQLRMNLHGRLNVLGPAFLRRRLWFPFLALTRSTRHRLGLRERRA